MKEGKAKLEHKGLVILLCVLLVAIVGLGVGIIVNNITQNHTGDLAEKEWLDNIECFRDGTSYDVGVCIDEIYASDKVSSGVSRDDLAIDLYNKAIDEALGTGDYDRARELLASRSNFFILENNCDVAIRLLDDGRFNELDERNRGVFYAYALDLGMDCNNDESVALWGDALAEYNNGVKDGLGF